MLLVGDIDTAFFTFVKPWVRLFHLTFICIREHYFTQLVLTCDHDLSFYISQKVNSLLCAIVEDNELRVQQTFSAAQKNHKHNNIK